jgi:hypothetical protein
VRVNGSSTGGFADFGLNTRNSANSSFNQVAVEMKTAPDRLARGIQRLCIYGSEQPELDFWEMCGAIRFTPTQIPLSRGRTFCRVGRIHGLCPEPANQGFKQQHQNAPRGLAPHPHPAVNNGRGNDSRWCHAGVDVQGIGIKSGRSQLDGCF